MEFKTGEINLFFDKINAILFQVGLYLVWDISHFSE